ncbi:unnamed protein product [Allacma fusca]|uniref:Uncharacterized protein n=1 Tax=Allacma fusca TaxID=39272 RepID=A0A8J2LQA1_9HEXA|nr:unnamed protein product [Allacma fusca]
MLTQRRVKNILCFLKEDKKPIAHRVYLLYSPVIVSAIVRCAIVFKYGEWLGSLYGCLVGEQMVSGESSELFSNYWLCGEL